MNNKIIGIVIGVLILGVVIFAGMNNPQMSPPRVSKLFGDSIVPDEIVDVNDGDGLCEKLSEGTILSCPKFRAFCDDADGWQESDDYWTCNGDVVFE